MPPPSVAIIGASTNRMKYGNRALRAHARAGYQVFPIHPHAEAVEGHRAYRSILDVPVERFDRVSLYVPPEIGISLLDEIAQKQVGEVWINPGAESPELFARAEALGLPTVFACSIIDVGADPHQID